MNAPLSIDMLQEMQRKEKKPETPYVLLNVVGSREKKEEKLLKIHKGVRNIHMSGPPVLWVLNDILSYAPCLETLRVTERNERTLPESFKNLLAENGVKLQVGGVRPNRRYDALGVRRKERYDKKRHFMLNLNHAQKEKFEELLRLGFKEARVLKRYLCLRGEQYLPMWKVGEAFGFLKLTVNHIVSRSVNAVLKYLDDDWKFCKDVSIRAREMKRRVAIAKAPPMKKEEVNSSDGEVFPKRLPSSCFSLYPKLLSLYRNGKMSELLSPRQFRVVTLRYGLLGGFSLTRGKISLQVGGISGERVRQLEQQALLRLGVLSAPTQKKTRRKDPGRVVRKISLPPYLPPGSCSHPINIKWSNQF